MKIAIETHVKASLAETWKAWNDPEAIKQWNTAQADWHTTHSEVDLRAGGRFVSRMAAKDGSVAFDFEGQYTNVVPQQLIEFEMADGRKVKVEFSEISGCVLVQEVFDAETEHSVEQQREGWQAILNNFASYVESSQ
ncbi:SRPBCC domain-containing protein [Aliidiomarina soli]|uniref:ATPase n=1 Tax=Aliidiomarina soli TaxID=1928574 RepID=A0A432WE03_9GAMM|nr:SRPBCC domain-containing protein [Aliidiomarina soli]RUO31092.1 ATPase [Aliidiomarina soli]